MTARSETSPPEGKRTVTVTIPGEPFALKRARAVRFGSFVRMHDDKRNVSWKGGASMMMQAAMKGEPPLSGPVWLSVTAYFSCPKGEERKREPRPRRWSTNAKDLDNIIKAVGDAGNGVLWLDDRQICSVTAWKFTAAQGEPARIEIKATELVPYSETAPAARGEGG